MVSLNKPFVFVLAKPVQTHCMKTPLISPTLQVTQMENSILELQYALDTFYFLVCGALVMWMAAGFCHEAGLVR